MTPSETLEQAADLIETYGHNRGGYGSRELGFCVHGAINYVETGKAWNTLAPNSQFGVIIPYLQSMISRRKFVALWSDDSPTQEVLDTLRTAAKEFRLEEEGIR